MIKLRIQYQNFEFLRCSYGCSLAAPTPLPRTRSRDSHRVVDTDMLRQVGAKEVVALPARAARKCSSGALFMAKLKGEGSPYRSPNYHGSPPKMALLMEGVVSGATCIWGMATLSP